MQTFLFRATPSSQSRMTQSTLRLGIFFIFPSSLPGTYKAARLLTEKQMYNKQAVRMVTWYAPASLLPVGAPVPRMPLSRCNVAVVSHAKFVLMVTAAPASHVKAALSKVAWWPFDLESGVRVTCDVGYLCANFGLPRPLCSRVRPDVHDKRQTSDKSIA